MKKVLGLTIAFLIAVAMLSMGTWAYFTSTQTFTGNRITAGTLDLLTNNVNGVTQTLYGLSIKANGTLGPSTITLKNAGSIDASKLSIAFSYIESDGSPNPVNKTADETAAIIEVTTLTYDGTDLKASIPILDGNSNGYIDVQDVKNANLTNLSGINAGLTKDFVIAAKVRDGISNDFQGDGVTATIAFTLQQ